MKITIKKPVKFWEIGKKDNQEDFLWPNPKKVEPNEQMRVFLMCDGVGGQDSGEVASETAGTAIGEYITSHMPDNGIFTKADFEAALAYGYDELDKVDTGAFKKMGTTMTCLVLHRGGALVAHIGDSRIYHVRPSQATEDGRTGIIYQTQDHSLVNDLLRAGEITEEEAINFPQKNVITRAMQPNLERRYKADIYNINDVQAGDYFFLCCDGVLEQLTNEKLGTVLSDGTLSNEEKRDAIQAVCDGVTRDNYTCWLIQVEDVKRENTDVVQEEEEVIATVEHAVPMQSVTAMTTPNAQSTMQQKTPTVQRSASSPQKKAPTGQSQPRKVVSANTQEESGSDIWKLISCVLALALIGVCVYFFVLRDQEDEPNSDEMKQQIADKPKAEDVSPVDNIGDPAKIPSEAEVEDVNVAGTTDDPDHSKVGGKNEPKPGKPADTTEPAKTPAPALAADPDVNGGSKDDSVNVQKSDSSKQIKPLTEFMKSMAPTQGQSNGSK